MVSAESRPARASSTLLEHGRWTHGLACAPLAAFALLHCGGATANSWSNDNRDGAPATDAIVDSTTARQPADDVPPAGNTDASAALEDSTGGGSPSDSLTRSDDGAPADGGQSPGPDTWTSGGPGADAGDSGFAEAEAGPPGTAWFRVAQLAADGHPYDFRWRATGATTWNGPVATGWGFEGGVPYGSVTEDIAIPAVPTDVSISYPGGPQAYEMITPAAGEIDTFVTFYLPGAYGGTYQYAPYVNVRILRDERSVDAGQAAIRALHVATTSSSNSTGDGTTATGPVNLVAGTTTLFASLPYGGLAPQSASVDAKGYTHVAPIASATLETVAPPPLGYPVFAQISGWSVLDGHVYTVLSFGLYASQTFPTRLAACDDTAAAVNHLRPCTTM